MYSLSNFSDSLNELITLHGLTEKSLSEKTDIPVSCISLYLRSLQTPYVDTLVKLADFFRCSVDYLLGLTDDCREKAFRDCPPFSERIAFLLKTSRIRPSKIYHAKTGISKSSYYEWKRGDSMPTLGNLILLAEFFNCSIDYLLGREA